MRDHSRLGQAAFFVASLTEDPPSPENQRILKCIRDYGHDKTLTGHSALS